MALALTVVDRRQTDQRFELQCQITASGSYVTSGDTLSLTSAGIPAGNIPVLAIIQGRAGYSYSYVPGTSAANGKVIVRQSAAAGSPLSELAAAAYPAGVTGDTIQAVFTFRRGRL